MIGLAVALASVALPLSVGAHVSDPLSQNRVVSVTAHTAPGASCSLADSVTGLSLQRTASATGRAVWRWRPNMWASGPDTVSVRCVKGVVRRATQYFFVLGPVEQATVIRDYALHLVYWAPGGDMPPDVEPAIAKLESDVQASLDAGATDNPFAIPRAYGDSLGGGDPRIASVDTTVDADPYPKPIEDYCATVKTPCLGSPNLANEVTRVARQHSWVGGNRTLVAFFTGPSVTVCYTRGPCTPRTEVCGYHALTGSGYAYAEVIMSGTLARCGGAASATYAIQVLEHEQDEVVVDPWGYGLEVADPCETDFASIPINGDTYFLQSILDNGQCSFVYTP